MPIGDDVILQNPDDVWQQQFQQQQIEQAKKAQEAVYGKNTGFKYNPQDLGWGQEDIKRLQAAGITKLPSWMNRESLYGGGFHLGSTNPIESYIELYGGSYGNLTNKYSGAEKAFSWIGGRDPNVIKAHGDEGVREAFIRESMGHMFTPKESWWERNKDPIMSVGSLAWPAAWWAGAGALGAGAAAGEVGAGAGAAGAGGIGAAGELGAGGWAGANALGAGAGAGAGITGAGSVGALEGTTGAGSVGAEGIAEAIAAGEAAGADVGMGAGTSWLTDLGLPASYGNDLSALLSYGADSFSMSDLLNSRLLNMALGMLGGQKPVMMSEMSGGGGSTAPKTSQIPVTNPMGGTSMGPISPTGSIMGAFGDKEDLGLEKILGGRSNYFDSIF